jgi:hypothetical protein
LPVSQHSTEKCTFITKGFGNLVTAADPISEETEREILRVLVQELNSQFPLNLSEDFICDRYLDEEVFQAEQQTKREIILIGSSHLSRVAEHLEADWEVINLTRPGWKISESAVSSLAKDIQEIMAGLNSDTATAVLQLYDNSVYKGANGNGELLSPVKGSDGRYHVDGCLRVADKGTVKALTSQLGPILCALGSIKKLFVSPLLRYWTAPCCGQRGHISNFGVGRYLGALCYSVHELRMFIRDSLFTKKVSNYRLVCPNRVLDLSQKTLCTSSSEAKAAAELWGDDPVHPGDESYSKIAPFIELDLANPEARYTNPPASVLNTARKRPCVDLSLQREDWVRGCQATLVRQDVRSSQNIVRGGFVGYGYRGHGRGSRGGAPKGGAYRASFFHRSRGRL